MELHKRLDKIQDEALQSIISELKLHNKTYICLPTGSGKTNLGIKIILKYGLKTLWITQGDELIQETRDRFLKYFDNVGLWQGKKQIIHAVTVASVQTLQNPERLKQLKKEKFELVIVDEAHHAIAPGWKQVISSSNYKYLIGLTATPERYDDGDIEEVFGNRAYHLNHTDAENNKIIAKAEGILVLTNSSLTGVQTSHKDYKPGQLERKVVCLERNKIIVNSYIKHTKSIKNKKTVCFCVSIHHAKLLSELFVSKGIKSSVLYGEMDKDFGIGQRALIYKNFKESKIEVLCVNNIMNEGKDVADINIVLMARPTLSPTIYIQQLGRASRFIENKKEKFFVIDYVDNTSSDYSITRKHFDPIKVPYIKKDFDIDYYNGHDFIGVLNNINRVSRPFELNVPDKNNIIKTCKEYINKNGSISIHDLLPKNGLPHRRVINKVFGDYQTFRKELGINDNSSINISKDQLNKRLIEFYKNKGSISTMDLGRKNNLPSITTVKKYYGTFVNCAKHLKLTNFIMK